MKHSFTLGLAVGIGAALSVGAMATRPSPQTLRPVEVRLDRMEIKPGKQAEFREWMDYLHRVDRASVKSMAGERNYFEATFTAPDDPSHLYWLSVTGEGGATPTKPPADLDMRHLAYLRDVTVRGSFRSLTTQNTIVPDFIVAAVRRQQQHEK